MGGSSLRSNSPGDGSGKPGLWNTRFAGAEWGAVGSIWWGICGIKFGSIAGLGTIGPMLLPLEWRSMGEAYNEDAVVWVVGRATAAIGDFLVILGSLR